MGRIPDRTSTWQDIVSDMGGLPGHAEERQLSASASNQLAVRSVTPTEITAAPPWILPGAALGNGQHVRPQLPAKVTA